MKFERLLWLFPIAVALHNLEEAIWMPAWDVQHAAELPVHAPGTTEIRAGLLGLTVAAFVVTWLCARGGRGSIWAYLTFGYVVAVLVNVVVPHVPAAILFHGYAAGVVTAVVVNLPFMILLPVTAVRDGWVSGYRAVAFGVGVPLVMGSAIVAWVGLR